MTSKELVKVFEQFARNTGKVKTLHAAVKADPTKGEEIRVNVAMECGFQPGTHRVEEPFTPAAEVVGVTILQVWGLSIELRSKYLGKISGYFEDEKWTSITTEGVRLGCATVKDAFRKELVRFENVLRRLVFEGIWGVEKDHWKREAPGVEMNSAIHGGA